MGMLYKVMYVLSKLYILPLYINNKNDGNIKVEFSFFCLKSLVNAILFSASSIITIVWIISNHLYYEEYFTKGFNLVYPPSDVWIMVYFMCFASTVPTFMVTWLFAYVWSKMKEVSRDPTIPFSKTYLACFVSPFLEIIAYIFIYFGNYLATHPFMKKYSNYENFVNIIVIPLIPSEINLVHQIFASMMMFSLIERVTYLLRKVQSSEDDIMRKIEYLKSFKIWWIYPFLA